MLRGGRSFITLGVTLGAVLLPVCRSAGSVVVGAGDAVVCAHGAQDPLMTPRHIEWLKVLVPHAQ